MCELIRETFSGISKMLPYVFYQAHFDRPLLAMLATKKSKQTKQKENRKQVHMHTGNTKVGKFYIRKDDR